MDKTALKSFAIYSREKLVKDISNKARLVGITEEGIMAPLSESNKDMKVFDIGEVETHKLYGKDVDKYEKLIEELEVRQADSDYKTAYKTLVEEVAYTWFNRIIALRFMEINNYMPDKMRVLSSERQGVKEPEIVTNYEDADIGIKPAELAGLEQLKLNGSAKAMEQLFNILFIKQCNALNKQLPELFEETDDYAELLLNISYNDHEGVIYSLIEDIGEEPFDVSKTGQIEVIGWLYQYYNTEPKAEVDAAVKKNKKVDKNTIPAKTQLFTPEWIVKYMVENSLGRLWIERKIARGTEKTEKELASEYKWKYYLPEADQIEEVKIELKNIREDRKDLKIEDIRFIDPSMGSGHVLVYAFDMFMQFYLEEGYTERDAAENIITKNLYGLDIDKRAYQLAYFSIMMKGRGNSRRILGKEIGYNLYYFIDSKDINKGQLDYLGGSIKDKDIWQRYRNDISQILNLFEDARELGSIIKAEREYDYEQLTSFVEKINDNDALPMDLVRIEETQANIIYILKLLETLSTKYEIAVTNPPYLANADTKGELKIYMDKKYSETKSDLFAIFMEKCYELLNINGYYGMINQHSWMFLSSFEKYRKEVLNNSNIMNMLHLGTRTFEEIGGEVVQSTAFIIKKIKTNNYKGSYIRLVEFKNALEKEVKMLEVIESFKLECYYETNEDKFELIPGSPVAYWASQNLIEVFENAKPISAIVEPKVGLQTGYNGRFLRQWYEVDFNKINFVSNSIESSLESKAKWFPYNKGGTRRQWYGNYDYVVNWENDGIEIRNFKDDKGKVRSRPQNSDFYFEESMTWSDITTGGFSIRYREKGSIHDVTGMSAFTKDHNKLMYLLGLMSTKISDYVFDILNPTIHLQIGNFSSFPLLESNNDRVIKIVEDTIQLAKDEWNSYEESWEFEKHPFLSSSSILIEDSYTDWKKKCDDAIIEMKNNEEELNDIFIKLYKLENDLSATVDVKHITLREADLAKDIKSFISYGVGCILGRYSLDKEGLIYAGGDFDSNNYNKLKPVEDNIVVITEDEYFEDDLTNRFIEFVKISFGEEYLEENLKFISDSLKGKGTSKENIRNYFVNDFYKDHVQTYKKTPIYWLYDSSTGKTKNQSQDGFKALIYMHRYDENTTGNVRIDYLHKVQRMYENRIEILRGDITHNSDAKQVAESEKKLENIMKKIKECKDYDEKIGHIAVSRVNIDLDDGVKVNYEKAQTDEKGEKYEILAKI